MQTKQASIGSTLIAGMFALSAGACSQTTAAVPATTPHAAPAPITLPEVVITAAPAAAPAPQPVPEYFQMTERCAANPVFTREYLNASEIGTVTKGNCSYKTEEGEDGHVKLKMSFEVSTVVNKEKNIPAQAFALERECTLAKASVFFDGKQPVTCDPVVKTEIEAAPVPAEIRNDPKRGRRLDGGPVDAPKP